MLWGLTGPSCSPKGPKDLKRCLLLKSDPRDPPYSVLGSETGPSHQQKGSFDPFWEWEKVSFIVTLFARQPFWPLTQREP